MTRKVRAHAPGMGTGLAIGGWFIPIGNLFLPWLGLRAAWRGARTDGSGLVGVWWITYVLGTLITVGRTLLSSSGYIDPELVWIYSAPGWLNLLLTFATYGTWLAVVTKITRTFGAGAPAPVHAGIPTPLAT